MIKINDKVKTNSYGIVVAVTILFNLIFKDSIFAQYIIPILCGIWFIILLFLGYKEKNKKDAICAFIGILYCIALIIWPSWP
jgi:hypothetical protein